VRAGNGSLWSCGIAATGTIGISGRAASSVTTGIGLAIPGMKTSRVVIANGHFSFDRDGHFPLTRWRRPGPPPALPGAAQGERIKTTPD
jgi:hypothetical protein